MQPSAANPTEGFTRTERLDSYYSPVSAEKSISFSTKPTKMDFDSNQPEQPCLFTFPPGYHLFKENQSEPTKTEINEVEEPLEDQAQLLPDLSALTESSAMDIDIDTVESFVKEEQEVSAFSKRKRAEEDQDDSSTDRPIKKGKLADEADDKQNIVIDAEETQPQVDIFVHQCESCPYSTQDSHEMVEHLKQHLDEARPFPCTYCNFSSKVKEDLTEHLRSHTIGDSPHLDFISTYGLRRNRETDPCPLSGSFYGPPQTSYWFHDPALPNQSCGQPQSVGAYPTELQSCPLSLAPTQPFITPLSIPAPPRAPEPSLGWDQPPYSSPVYFSDYIDPVFNQTLSRGRYDEFDNQHYDRDSLAQYQVARDRPRRTCRSTVDPNEKSEGHTHDAQLSPREKPSTTHSETSDLPEDEAGPDKLPASKSPVMEAFVYCALQGWGLHLLKSEGNEITFKVDDFELYCKKSSQICSKQHPTRDREARIKALKRWFPDFPKRRDGPQLDKFTISTGKDRIPKMKKIIATAKKLVELKNQQPED